MWIRLDSCRSWWKCLSLRRWRWLGAIFLALALAGFAIYRASPALLTVDSGTATAQAIVVLGGDSVGRPARAAELFAAGDAARILVSGDGDSAEVVEALAARGVPRAAIQVENKSRSTRENAVFSVAMLRQAGVSNAIIVTSWYHSRRALNCFRKAAPDMTFYSRPSYFGLDRAEWSRTGVGAHVRAEYVKLLGYWVCYGISPF